MQDPTFEQAMQNAISRTQNQFMDEVQKRVHFLVKGQTLADATADLDPNIRLPIADLLLQANLLAIISMLHTVHHLINQDQANELHDLLSERLKPRISKEEQS